MNFKNKVLLISLLGVIALWHCRNRTTPSDTTPAASGNPDLIVEINANRTNALPSEEVTLKATVINAGGLPSPTTTLNWYFSADASLNLDTDTSLETEKINSLTAGEGRTVSKTILVSDVLGSYYYFTCVDAVTDEMNTNNNCSSAAMVVVVPVPTPDLTVESVSAGSTSVASSGTLTLTATVSNTGTGSSPATDLRWYRSIDNSLDTAADNTPQGTETVSILAAGEVVMVSNSNAITVPNIAGTYHYFACVDEVTDETDTSNNCSSEVMVGVTTPDLTVESMSANSNSVDSSEMLTLTATVSNTGTGSSPATDLRWYRSIDNSLDTAADNTPQGTETVSILAAGEGGMFSNTITAPSTADTYHYFACVDEVMDEVNTNNNCSTGVMVEVTAPDLTVESMSANSNSIASSGMLTLTATVSNTGTGSSPATDLRWHRSIDNSLDTVADNTPQGTETVSILAAGEGGMFSNTVTAPSTVGTYHYFACVDEVMDEINTNNNCSSAVKVEVIACVDEVMDGVNTNNNCPPMVEVTAPDLTIESMSANSNSVAPSGMLTLTATVNNTGTGSSPATDLRWHRSIDSSLDTTADNTLQGTEAVSILAAGEGGMFSNTVMAPSTVGAYHYFVCVDEVMDEINTNNNCSFAVKVKVILGIHLPTSDFNTLFAADNRALTGIWSDGTNMWVADSGDDKLYTYDLASKNRVPAKEFALAAENGNAAGIWSDGITMWVANFLTGKIYTYDLARKNRIPAKEFNLDPFNTRPIGIWSDGTTMWIADLHDDMLYAYDMMTKGRVPAKEFNLAADNGDLRGIWSDGRTMWVADSSDDKLYAYKMSDRTRDSAKDFNTLSAAGNTDPYGIWSDGTTMWVGSSADSDDRKLYAYDAQFLVHTNSLSSVLTNLAAITAAPDLIISTLSASTNTIAPSGTITLTATVRNIGASSSTATTLRWYLSTDAAIGTTDTPAGTKAVSTLEAGANATLMGTVTASMTTGTYYYGVCVDSVTGEYYTSDNCSSAVRVDVPGE